MSDEPIKSYKGISLQYRDHVNSMLVRGDAEPVSADGEALALGLIIVAERLEKTNEILLEILERLDKK